ncbi:MAG TPA: TraR/DksA C4-type zinc finger protein [Streptosporangiaceae bacterium]|nr:TraR/DksA C4-type zinc finger protein [Streptosporangiaceae bacterium]
MSSTSIVQTAVRSVPAGLHRRPAGTANAGGRPVHAGPGGLAQRRALLEACWRDRLERVTALSLAYHDAAQTVPPGPAGRRGASARRARQLARKAVAERQALAEIEAALERIAAGQYGWCEQCSRPISAALLAAQPQARYCAACKRSPHRNQQQCQPAVLLD